jgi:nitrite reductase (NADH) large subunit
MKRYLIVGAGVAGVSAAKTLRQHDADCKITIYTTEYHPMGYYARKDLARRFAQGAAPMEAFLIEDEEALARQNIRFLYEEVVRVLPEQGVIMLPHSYRQAYDGLLLACGATPMLVDAPGTHLIGVNQLRNYDDLLRIETWIEEIQQHGAVILGGGILALEMAYALRRRGVPTTMIVRDAHVGLPLLSDAAARLVEARLKADGVRVLLNTTLTAYLSIDDKVLDAVQLSNGETLPARLALSAIGVRPTTDWIAEEGFTLDQTTGALIVDQHLRTNFPNVYAAGNCAQVNGFIARGWDDSAEQGRIAALNMLGHETPYTATHPTNLNTQIYDLPLAYFGDYAAGEVRVLDGDNLTQIDERDGRVIGALLLGERATAQISDLRAGVAAKTI